MRFRLYLIFMTALLMCCSEDRAGQWIARGSDKIGANLFGVTYTPKGFFAVGPGGTLARSTSGKDWQVQPVNPGDLLIGVGYGAGVFVMVGANYEFPNYLRGVLWRSGDGSTWERIIDDAAGAMTRVAYGGGRFVAVGGSGWFPSEGVTATSTNGTLWEHQRTPFSTAYLKDVTFVQDRFLRAELGGVFASMNGVDWTDTHADLPGAVGLASHGSMVVAVSRGGAIKRSLDRGRTWEAAVHSYAAGRGLLMDVGASPNLFMGVGDGGYIVTSVDGLAWAIQDSKSTELLEDVAYGEGTWVVVGRGGTILTSSNATEWTSISSPTRGFSGVTFGGDRFVAVSDQAVVRSEDGISWESIPGQTAVSVSYGQGLFVAVGNDIKVSRDGLEWVPCLHSTGSLAKVVYGNGEFVAVGGVNPSVYSRGYSAAYRSVDGTNWSGFFGGLHERLDSLAFDGRRFIASSSFSGTRVGIESGQATIFFAAGVPVDVPAGGLAFGHAGLLSVERRGHVLLDGKRSPEPLGPLLSGAAYVDGHYLVFGGGWDGGTLRHARLWVSETGTDWRELSVSTDRVIRAAAAGRGHLVVVGDGIILERALDDGLIDSSHIAFSRRGSSVSLKWFSKRGHRYLLENSTELRTWEPIMDPNGAGPLAWGGTGSWLNWQTDTQATTTSYRLRITVE